MSYQFCESGGVEGAGPHEKPKAEGVRGLETRKERGEETAPVDSTGKSSDATQRYCWLAGLPKHHQNSYQSQIRLGEGLRGQLNLITPPGRKPRP